MRENHTGKYVMFKISSIAQYPKNYEKVMYRDPPVPHLTGELGTSHKIGQSD